MATDPQPAGDAPEPSGSEPVLAGLVLVTACYLIVFVAAWVIARWWLLGHLQPAVSLIAPARRRFLIDQALGLEIVPLVALLSLVFLAPLLMLQAVRGKAPLDSLGLVRRGAWSAIGNGGVQGVVMHLGLLLVAAALGGGPLGVARQRQALLILAGHWREQDPATLLALPVALTAYSLARVLVPFGVVLLRARRRLSPVSAALWASVAFTLPYALSPLHTPLALVNLFLLGLVLAQLVYNSGRLWTSVGALAGWALIGELSGLPHQGALSLIDAGIPAAPALLGGGAYGPEGGLLMTSLMLLWLASLLSGPASTETPESTADHPA